ncbi:hypothetical protein V2H45_19400 [Tumidithrix elongata RA019]|uniref:Uncharacterized protein n=1 Tax=Tumidithrix elongata BACA0141 TaxID=2716417 RepID=A0AAW9PU92_9CYAN|nr:hypothetical protein [Tumidithrix elongata RA019]
MRPTHAAVAIDPHEAGVLPATVRRLVYERDRILIGFDYDSKWLDALRAAIATA